MGTQSHVDIKKVIHERLRRRVAGLDLDADVNAAIAANVGESGQTTSVSSTSTATAGTRPKQEHERPSK